MSIRTATCSTLDAGLTIAVGFVVSFLVAWVVVKTFIGFVGRYGLKPFGWYRIIAGALILRHPGVMSVRVDLLADHPGVLMPLARQ